MSKYPLLPVHPDFQSPSGEQGQILLDGIVMRISLYHGKIADEADWHVYIDPDPSVWQTLGPHLRSSGIEIWNNDLDVFYCELMVTDRHRNETFDEFFDSADLTAPFRLSKPGSTHPAWDMGLFAGDNQGINHDFSNNSRLVTDGGRAYLQGAFVNDEDHGTRIEIHPLDSIAFAMDASGKTISEKRRDPNWPMREVRWRVAWFGNSSFHRINDEPYMQKERTTTWFLDLPGEVNDEAPRWQIGGPITLVNFSLETIAVELWDGQDDVMYDRRGVVSIDSPELRVDPRDNRVKLRVSATMEEPDKRGGLVVRDYVLKVSQQVVRPV